MYISHLVLLLSLCIPAIAMWPDTNISSHLISSCPIVWVAAGHYWGFVTHVPLFFSPFCCSWCICIISLIRLFQSLMSSSYLSSAPFYFPKTLPCIIVLARSFDHLTFVNLNPFWKSLILLYLQMWPVNLKRYQHIPDLLSILISQIGQIPLLKAIINFKQYTLFYHRICIEWFISYIHFRKVEQMNWKRRLSLIQRLQNLQ